MGKNVLLIIEGDSDEPKFFDKLFSKCNRKAKYKFYSYRTTIHILSQELYNNYPDFDDGYIDIKLILASLEKDEQKKALLLSQYSDIYLVFDFEPQHDHPHFDTVRRMIAYFNDSTNQGKLFINYPMMQSYKHFDKLPCPNYEFLKVTLDEIKDYKRIVGEFSNYTDLNTYDYIIFYSIAIHNLKKANKLFGDKYEIYNDEKYVKRDFTNIFDYQLQALQCKEIVYVLNTCIFALIDFAPKKFFSFIEKHRTFLLID